MSSADQRLPRLLALVPYVLTHQGIRTADLAAAFGVTERQVLADLELLFVCGLPGGTPDVLIEISFVDDRVWIVLPQNLDRPLRLTSDEAVALLVAARALADVDGLTDRAALERAIGKLQRAVAANAAPLLEDVVPRVEVAIEPEAGPTLAAVRAGLAEARALHLRYHVESRDEVTDRVVDPMELHLREGRWYLEAWARDARDVRLFRLDRVLAVDVLAEPAHVPADARRLDLTAGLYRPGADDARVLLELEPSARWVADYYHCSVTEAGNGRLRAELRTADPRWVARLVLSLGGRARVVEPESLAEHVRERAAAGLAAYGEPPVEVHSRG